MAATDLSRRNPPPVDDTDDSLFDYDVGDAFRDVDTNMDVTAVHQPATRTDGKEDGASLGIDEEIKVTRKRVPVPKLDANRLLSPAGIPKLRRVVKERLKFKGRGHEYSDVVRLLNAYQLWLDDLYPRAKFADGLAIIEKLGHTKHMQTMRREWIQEGKPRETLSSLDQGAEKLAGQQKSGQERCWEVEPTERPRTPVAFVGGDDDLYAATPKSSRADRTANGNSDTETLFLGDTTKTVPVLGQERGSLMRDGNFDDDDDEEALLALNNVW